MLLMSMGGVLLKGTISTSELFSLLLLYDLQFSLT